MSHVQEYTSLWWPEERIKATLNAKYIVSRLRQENIPRLFELPDWGEGLTSETYMEWILTKAGRVFLILDAIGIPDRIFALVDQSCDDDDLPIAEHSVDLLCLSPDGEEDIALDTRFFHMQWRFLVRGIGEGEHVVYTENEGVPVEVVRSSTSGGLHGRDETVDKVILAGSVCRVYMRTQVKVGGAPHFFSSDEVLTEIRQLRRLSHEHIVSVYASYLKDDNVAVLFTGAAADRNLHSFLTDEPISFKRLAKEHRRQILITWPHCLASAVSWLHSRGYAHGAIRPSNIFIDATFHICLGQFQALDSLLTPPHVNDLEAYNYSAPERWTRLLPQTVQPKPQQPVQVQTLLPSGGRTKRRQRPGHIALAPVNESPLSSPRPDSASSKGTVIRVGLPNSPSRFSFACSSSSSSSGASSAASSIYQHPTNTTTNTPTQKQHRLSTLWARSTKRTPSIMSSTSSTSLQPHIPQSKSPSPSPTTNKTTFPSDIFSLAAITLDILTTLHKRTLTSFSAHRSARNRSAGRGGGIADASFHLARNSVQVQSWIALLEGDALKRCRRDRRSEWAFWAVPRILIVVRAMLDGEVGKRPGARRVRRLFGEAILRGEGGGGGEGLLHCGVVEEMMMEGKGMDGEMERAEVRAVPVVPSESASEFDFGFPDASSESDVEEEEDEGSEFEYHPEIRVEQVSPQLYLPDLDMNIGMEGLTLNK
ncbi:uncharacterized protein N7515_004504 [Penicillium bovifimosum]|uniref:Protein kinase domain-containing protein n=1 Tax=Penicillium bovifimosum TaxID=126998 RepID=A0A9W9L3J6_9EURO|nr:uncharacterized protein N7515_004504 [Penicillium bovifimosum]KAJ5135226.1 hypothetical protein N7515_004504 [Penicillium bovifimosum]